jgi:trigger factor
MEVSVQKLEGLQCRVDVTVPASEVSSKYNAKVAHVCKTAKIDGYRPGKASPKLVEDRFGQGILYEICGDLIDSSFQDAIKSNNLRVAGRPQIEPKEFNKNQPLEYSATFETYPEIKLTDLSGQTIEKPVAAVEAGDISKVLDRLRNQHADWQQVDRPAKEGDRMLIDFEGFIDGEAFEGGKAEGFQLEIGAKRMIPGFEEAMIGAAANQEPVIKVTFPKDYHAADLAGKPAEFKIKVHQVLESKLPELNDALAEKVGVKEGLAKLNEQVKKSMEAELDQALKNITKNHVLEKLIELNPLTLPAAAVDAEIRHIQQVTLQRMMKEQGIDPKDMPKFDMPREPFVKQAERRVSLGLLLAEVVKAGDIKLDQAQLKAKVEEIAQVYHNPEQVVQWYYQNPEMLSEVESLVLEEAAINFLLEKAKVVEKKLSFEEVVNTKPAQDDHGHDHEEGHVHGPDCNHDHEDH